jgi:hypothetical protein
VCGASAEVAVRLNQIGQVLTFGLAAAVAILARSFRVKLTALVMAPILGVLIYVVAGSTIVSR